MGVTSIDVAKAAGVSQPTVSRALRGDPSVNVQTRERILEIAKRMGYVPSERGRSLSTSSTRRVAMVVDLDNPLWPLLVRSLHDTLEANDLRLTLVAGHGDAVATEEHLLGGGVDGVIMSTVTLTSQAPRALAAREVPLVLLNRVVAGPGTDAAVADDEGGGRLAAEILIEAGHTRLGAIFGPEDTSTGRGRERGFRRGLAAAGIELPEAWVRHGPFDHAHGRRALPELADEGGPTAVFCANDVIAIGAIDAARERGLSVPGDIGIVGFDDLKEAGWRSFDLTTIAVPFDDMVTTAVGMLVERLKGHTGPGRTVVHGVTAVQRGSHLRG